MGAVRIVRGCALLGILGLVSPSPAVAQTASFSGTTLYSTGTTATQGVAVVDVNQDRKPDLIVATGSGGTVRVRLGNGSGGFGTATDFAVSGSAFGLAVADFNRDGSLDVATVDSTSNKVNVLLGRGDGTFAPAVQFVVGSAPANVIAADLNGDGFIDLATANFGSNSVTVLLGNGAGGFAEAAGSPVATGTGPQALAAGDLNGDAITDLVVANRTAGSFSVLLGIGLGKFTTATTGLAAGFTPRDIAILDVSRDGIPDLVIVGVQSGPPSSGQLLTYTGNNNGFGLGDGTFTATAPTTAGALLSAIALADVNGDGVPDVAVTDSVNNAVLVFQGNGAGGLGAPLSVPTGGTGPAVVTTGDVNGDGKLDLAVGHATSFDTSIVLNTTCCFVTVKLAGFGSGLVTSSPGGISCGIDCVRGFPSATAPTLTAAADVGFLFTGWSGACTGAGLCSLPAGVDSTVTATFDTLLLAPATLSGGQVGVAYTAAVTATNGTPPDLFTVAAGSLPAGLTLASNGTLSGVPLQGGTFSFVVQGVDAVGVAGTRALTLTILPSATATAGSPASAVYNDAPQTVTLSAAVSSPVTVGGGTVTFTVRNAANAVIGSPGTAAVVNGIATLGYVLPGGTPSQALTITSAYSGNASFVASSGTSTFTVLPAPTTTAGAPATAAFNTAVQTVTLSATVASPNGAINAGTVTFTVRDAGNVVVGVPVSASVSGGAASAGYAIPAGTNAQTLSVGSAYSGSVNFTSSGGSAQLSILPAGSTTAPANTSVVFSTAPQTIPLSAAVTSPSGTVGSGTVTFTVRDAALNPIGSSLTGAVTSGAASVLFTVPGGMTTQTLSIGASFSGMPNILASSGGASLVVACPAIALAPAFAPLLRLGQPFSLTLTAAGITDPVFALTGTVPGLTVTGATISGTPAALGQFPVIAKVTSAISGGCSVTKTYALNVMRTPSFAASGGTGAVVQRFDALGTLTSSFFAEAPAFTGGIRVAMADFNGDGVDDIVTAPGLNAGGSTIRVFDGATGVQLRSFPAYPYSSPGGTYVAAGDVNGDGIPDIITGRDGAPPEVRVFDGRTGTLLADFLAYPPGAAGGVRVAAGDVDGDGFAEIITGPDAGGTPQVRVFSGDGTLRSSFLAYDATFTGGVYVAAGDVDGDGRADIITGAGAGGGPHVRVFSGVDLHELRGFFAYTPGFTGGVRVAAGDLNLDGRAEILTAPGPGGGPHVRVWDGATGSELLGLYAFAPTFTGGVFVGAPVALSRIAIDTPGPGPTGSSTFLVGGWAGQPGAIVDSGVDAIHVWAVPVKGGAPIFVGATAPNVPRPDVAATFGGTFGTSGFNLVAGPLPSGTYDLVAFAHSSRSGTFNSRATVRIVVP